jgi:hypothetical protein
MEFHGAGNSAVMADVLKTSRLFLDHQERPDDLTTRLRDFGPSVRLGLDRLDPKEVFETVKKDVSVGSALG